MKMPFKPKYFLPELTNNFYRYVGSLTTPPCSQQVIWTLFVNQLELSERQVQYLLIQRKFLKEKLLIYFRPMMFYCSFCTQQYPINLIQFYK